MDLNAIRDLAEEARRVITAPYAVSLQRLLNILQIAKPIEISCWGDCYGCQIEPLAGVVLEALELWPNTIQVAGRLCHANTFRDALLIRDPSILSLLLDKASSSDLPSAGLEDLCIRMLSDPLPVTCAIPASIHTFYTKLVKRTISYPSVSTIQPLYSIVKGVGTKYLASMSDDLSTRLQRSLIELLKGIKDHVASLLCLAIFARLSANSHPISPQDGSSSPETLASETSTITDTKSIPSQAKNLFVGRRASKALELAILQAITACSENRDSIDLASHEILAVATAVVKAIDAGDRGAWIKKSAQTIQKYRERLLRHEVSDVSRLAGFELWAALTNGCQAYAFDEDIVLVENALERIPRLTQPSNIITTYGGKFSTPFIKNQLIKAMIVASRMERPCSIGSMLEVTTAVWIVESFIKAIKTKNRLRKTVLIALTSNEFRRPLQQFLNTRLDNSSGNIHSHGGLCEARMTKATQLLRKKLSTLFLLSFLLSSFDDIGTDPALATDLLRMHGDASTPPPKCQLFQNKFRSPKESLSLFQIGGTQASQSRNWRDQLASELAREADQAHSKTIRFVNDVCRDLEERCHNVERPLRDEHAKLLTAERKCDLLQKKFAVLEREALDQASNLESVKNEKMVISEQLQDREILLETLRLELGTVRHAATDASESAKRNAEYAQETLKTKDIEYQTVITSKDTLLENQASHISSLEMAHDTFKEKINSLQLELTRSNETHSLLLDQRHNEMEQAKKAKSKYSREMEKLRDAEKEERIKESESLKSQIFRLREDFKLDRTKMEDTISNLEYTVNELQETNTRGLKEKAAEYQGKEEQLQRSILTLEERLSSADQTAALLSERHKDAITQLESAVSKAREETTSISNTYTLEIARLRDVIAEVHQKAESSFERHTLETTNLQHMLSHAEENAASSSLQHRLEIERLEEMLKSARDANAMANEVHTADVANLKKKIIHLTEQQKEQAKELAEALELRSKMMGLMGVSNSRGQPVTVKELTNVPVTQEPGAPDPANSTSPSVSSKQKQKPKPKRVRQSATIALAQSPIKERSRLIKSQSRGCKEKREPLRERRATMNNAIISSPARSPQKKGTECNQLQGDLYDAENVRFSSYEDLDDVLSGEAQMLMDTQLPWESERKLTRAEEVDLDATL